MTSCLKVKLTKTRIAVLWAMEMVEEGNPAVLEVLESRKVTMTEVFVQT